MAEFLFTRDGEFQAIVVDVTIEENHSDTAMITEHPVESGGSVSDHVKKNPDRLTAVVFVTDTPIISPNVDGANGSTGPLDLEGASSRFTKYAKSGEAAEQKTTSYQKSVNVLSFPDGVDRVRAVYDAFRRAKDEGVIFSVITSLREYESLVIADISAPKSAKSGGSVTMTIEFREFRFVSTETIDAPEPLETRAERERRRGAQGAEEEPSEQRRSMAAALIEDGLGIGLIRGGS